MDWQRARKPEQKAFRRREIIEAAYALFSEMEYGRISLNAIARGAGISKPNIYRYFASREEIFLQIFLDTFEAWSQDLREALAQCRRPVTPRRVAEVWTAVTREHPRMLRLAPMLMTSMERNSSEEGLYAFKKAVHELMNDIAGDLKTALPSMSEAGCRHVLLCGYGLVAGLGPMTCPNKVLARVMDRLDPNGRQPDFDELMTHALTALIEKNTRRQAEHAAERQPPKTGEPMFYREMPKNGDQLSILGFGCMRLPEINGVIDEERALRQLRDAIDRGVNYIDTAWPYHAGQSEPFVGRALADGYREKVKLATKLPSWMVKDRADMDRFLNAQLEKLNTDHIDYYLAHCLVGELWDKIAALGIAEFLDTAKADGRIVNAGFSFHGSPDDFTRIIDAYAWDFCQIQYNYLDEENQAGTKGLEYAASKGLGVIVMEPLRGGKLAGPVPESIEAIWNEAEVKRTPVEWALRWIWNRPEVTVVLSGMKDEAHVDENLRIAGQASANSLTDSELQRVGRAEQMYRKLMKAGCTGCRYCLPCPAGVAIPICLELYNDLHMFQQPDEARFMYPTRLGGILSNGQPGYASQCVKCGKCLEKCPQGLDIPALLESVVQELEGPDLAAREATARQLFTETSTDN